MRETKLGRWVVRVACAMGVGAAVLGLPAVAFAADGSQAGVVFYEVPGQITQLDRISGIKTEPVYTTDDTIWT
jgi:hypothetical protein